MIFSRLFFPKQLIIAFLSLLLTFSLFCVIPASTSSVEAQQTISGSITKSSESQALQQMIRGILSANGLSQDLVQQAYVEPSDSLNAYTDGTRVVVTEPLWRKLTTADQRAFVVGHELAHDVLHHIEKTTARRVGVVVLDRVFGRFLPNQPLRTASQLGLQLVDRKFSRNDEYQADELGIQLMRKAGYRPQAALQVFDTLKKASARGATPEFLLTHPIPESRIQALSKKYQL